MSTTIVTALIYTRVSSDEQATHGLSLDAQLAECRQYAVRQSDWVIGREFCDVLSGLKDQRRDYQALLQHTRDLRASGNRVAVVVAALDRFGRRVLERVRSREELKALGVPTHSVREGGEVSDLVANILAAVAEEETRRLGERVRATRAHLRATGWKPPGRAGLGYRWRMPTAREKGEGAPSSVLDIDPMTADVVREAFARVAEGESIRRVAAWLSRLPPDLRGSKDMALTVVSSLLRAPVYVARPDTGDPDVLIRPIQRWPALVDDLTWQRVQRFIAGHTKHAHQATGRFLLIGYFRCPKCGNRVTGHATKRWGLRYRCATLPHAEETCRWAISVGTIDRPVLGSVADLLGAVERIDSRLLAEEWRRLSEGRDPDGLSRVTALKRQIAGAKDRLLRATRLYVDGAIDSVGYELARDDAQETIAGAEGEIARLGTVDVQPSLPDLRIALQRFQGWNATLAQAPVQAQRDVLAVLVDAVDVGYVRPLPGRRNGRYRVSVRWTPLAETLRAFSV